ncbi:hypothetical protein [Paracoccus sp. (in: a-proteobacteria)]|uniref:hypothetical protein n=1 Tax=Paracoccus sp. TaxID=267 RepID=UPI0026DF9599|nr:hypothetical protein [Paracoccus sp. (in: a-proteobacteria)]MDO5370570.1 hypothetical protein [Paracoccus sp. (in: a-proteobacteria)]
METKERVRANTPGLSRRSLIASMPMLALAAVPKAQASGDLAFPAETPVAALFREWERINEEVHAAYAADDDDAGDRAYAARWAHEQILIHEPSQCERDVLLKIAVWTDTGESDLEVGNPHLATVWAELRSMFGARALIGA